MVEFLQGVVPVRTKSSEQIISSDTHSNTANFKFTYSVEIIPICKDDLVLIPPKQAKSLSNISPLTICTRVGNSVHLIDPSTLQYCDITSNIYWRTPFDSLATVTDLMEFTVLDIEPDHRRSKGKFVMADAQVALAGAFRSSSGTADDDEMMDYDAPSSSTNQIYHTRTHLGAILQPGDTVMGYHLTNTNFNSSDFALLEPGRIPDIILVKKAYPNRRKKSKARAWRLRSISKEAGEEGETGNARGVVGRLGGRDQKKVDEDYELFLRDIEEDPEIRAGVNLYKVKVSQGDDVKMVGPEEGGGGKGRKKKRAQFAMDVDEREEPEEVVQTTIAGAEEEQEEADFPEVSLDELLEDFDEMTLGPDAISARETE
ncbi:hypothetical protein C0993_010456 [Termitomyces sp. T159_Od127]|nr:hypothetical protein C0993_010456 [Termitomyces sp. T159_Od127]